MGIRHCIFLSLGRSHQLCWIQRGKEPFSVVVRYICHPAAFQRCPCAAQQTHGRTQSSISLRKGERRSISAWRKPVSSSRKEVFLKAHDQALDGVSGQIRLRVHFRSGSFRNAFPQPPVAQQVASSMGLDCLKESREARGEVTHTRIDTCRKQQP